MSVMESARPRAPRCVWQSPQSPRQIDRACGDRTPSTESECAGHCSFVLFLVENGRHQIRRHRLEMGWFHRITGAPFGKRTDGSRVTEQLGKRNLSMNNGEVPAGLDIVNAATTPAQIAANVSLKLVRRDIFDLHDRLQQNGFA